MLRGATREAVGKTAALRWLRLQLLQFAGRPRALLRRSSSSTVGSVRGRVRFRTAAACASAGLQLCSSSSRVSLRSSRCPTAATKFCAHDDFRAAVVETLSPGAVA